MSFSPRTITAPVLVVALMACAEEPHQARSGQVGSAPPPQRQSPSAPKSSTSIREATSPKESGPGRVEFRPAESGGDLVLPRREEQQLRDRVSEVLLMLHQKRFAQLAPLVHPVRGLTIEDAENVVPSVPLADFVRRKLSYSATCVAQRMSFASYVEAMVRRTSIDYTQPRDVHLMRR